MAWFFTENELGSDSCELEGENLKHARVLRLREGEAVTLVTPSGLRHDCEVSSAEGGVTLRVTKSRPCENEPDVFVTLYQALPKGDKMDYIVQKCVELGVSRIVPMLTERCVSRPDEKALKKKRERWQKIALQAAMQSRRGKIPEVCGCIGFRQAVEDSLRYEKTVFFYEMGGASVKKILSQKPASVGMFIGSEGGFSQGEAEYITGKGGDAATLGKRILRAETAPLAALSIIMYQTDNF